MENLIKKIHEAVKDMYSQVDFDEKEHRYTRKSDGKWFAGISSIADVLPKPYLKAWAAKMVSEFLQDKQEKIKELSANDYLLLLDEAKNTYRRKSEDALDFGTIGHAHLEKYVLAKIRNTELPMLENKELERPIQQFIRWEQENIKQWLLSEARVCDIDEEIAGTLDGLAILKNDKLAIIDFKFANQISQSYHIQTAGYALPFEKYGIEVNDRIIIRLPKTLIKKVYDRKTRQYNEVDNNIEIGRSPFSYEFDKEAFKSARILYRYLNAFEQ